MPGCWGHLVVGDGVAPGDLATQGDPGIRIRLTKHALGSGVGGGTWHCRGTRVVEWGEGLEERVTFFSSFLALWRVRVMMPSCTTSSLATTSTDLGGVAKDNLKTLLF